MLREGGNAVDAAVAVGFALAVVHPSAGNLGGGGFMVIRLANGELVANDHREKAPSKAHRDMYLDENGEVVEGLSTASHLAVGVPGSVDGLLGILARHGTVSRKEIIAPAIALARDGFALPADLAGQFARLRKRFEPYPASLAKFTRADGSPWEAGDVFRQPDLAATLMRIAEHGRAGFYEGVTADLIVREMARGGGLISHEDLADYRAVWREPVVGTYRDHQIVSMPPPSSGGALLVQMLNMLEPLDLAALGRGSAAGRSPHGRSGAARLRRSRRTPGRCRFLRRAAQDVDGQGTMRAAGLPTSTPRPHPVPPTSGRAAGLRRVPRPPMSR